MIAILTRQTGILSWRVFIHEVQSFGTVEGSFSLAIQTGRDFFFADTDLFSPPWQMRRLHQLKIASSRVLFIKQRLHFQYFNSFLIQSWDRWIEFKMVCFTRTKTLLRPEGVPQGLDLTTRARTSGMLERIHASLFLPSPLLPSRPSAGGGSPCTSLVLVEVSSC